MSHTIQEIAALIKARPCSGHWRESRIVQLSIDSRNIFQPESTLFIALKGGHRDGHSFLQEAYHSGVRNFLVSEQPPDCWEDANILLVPDTLSALQQLATAHRKEFSIPVIGITGSNGKTVVKEWLYQILHEKLAVIRSPRSYNSQIGVPLSIWPMAPHQELAIFEAGISRPGEMEKLAAMIDPVIGVFTGLGAAHDSGFSSRKEKLMEKWKLFKNARKLVYPQHIVDAYFNSEDLALLLPDDKEYFSWGEAESATIRTSIEFTTGLNSNIQFQYQGKSYTISFPFSDEASLENASTVCSTLLALGYSLEEFRTALETLEPVQMRLELKNAVNNSSLINDSYSADLRSLEIALQFMHQRGEGKKRTVILSDFLESGIPPAELYAAVAELLKRFQVRKLLAIGPEINRWMPEALSGQEMEVSYFLQTAAFLKQFLSSQFREEIILVKGARIFAFEEIAALLEQKNHETELEINLGAIVRNLSAHRAQLPAGTRLMAMVKAFAYGSGGAEIGTALQYQKIDYLGVAYTDEGVELRKAGIQVPIMVLNTEPGSFDNLTQHHLEPVIFSQGLLESFSRHLSRHGFLNYPVHLELETGMNRLGFSEQEIGTAGEWILKHDEMVLRTLFSHLVGSDDPALDSFSLHQQALLQKAASLLKEQGHQGFWVHLANSAAIQRMPVLAFDMVRIGIGLYGIGSLPNAALEPAVRLKSSIAQLHSVKKEETVSYNRSGKLSRDSVIATVRIGYADGYSRVLGNGRGKMWVNGQLAPTVGNICMDMTMIDVSNIPAVREGDQVTVFGAELPLTELAAWAGTIPYEIMTGISQRVKRVYFEE